MDLIQTIINKKQNTAADLDLEKLLREIDMYNKLSVNKAFRDLSNPILENKLPMLYSVKTNDQLLYVLHELKQELLFITDHKLCLFDYLNAKKLVQKTILGSINNYNVKHKNLYDFTDLNKKCSYVFAQTTLPNDLVAILILEQDSLFITAYTGVCEPNVDLDSNINTIFTYNNVSLKTYSSRGYNDYAFARINGYDVSMPNKNTLRYEYEDKVIDKELSINDQNALKMTQTPNKTICVLIEKYKPSQS